MKTIGKIISFAAVATVLTKLTQNLLKKESPKTATATGTATNSAPNKSANNQNKNVQPAATTSTPQTNTTEPSPKFNTEDFSDSRTQKMYKELGMTDEQRKKYEADYLSLMTDWDQQNPSKPMDIQERNKRSESALNAVLNEDQYAIYRDWAKDHAG